MGFGALSLKGRALRYLAQREHSRAELERKLARFVDEEADETSARAQIAAALDELAAKGFLSDQRTAESVLRSQGARFGSRRLKQTMQAKGLAPALARRLAESGARFIEVTTEYVPFLHWDTHENGHTTYDRMKKEIDRPIAQLILDLEQRGLLDRTLVVLATEFSRDMMIEGVPGSTAKDQSRAKTDVLKEKIHYGLHRHFDLRLGWLRLRSDLGLLLGFRLLDFRELLGRLSRFLGLGLVRSRRGRWVEDLELHRS